MGKRQRMQNNTERSRRSMKGLTYAVGCFTAVDLMWLLTDLPIGEVIFGGIFGFTMLYCIVQIIEETKKEKRAEQYARIRRQRKAAEREHRRSMRVDFNLKREKAC